jgi:hypothetical protein
LGWFNWYLDSFFK